MYKYKKINAVLTARFKFNSHDCLFLPLLHPTTFSCTYKHVKWQKHRTPFEVTLIEKES